MVAVRELAAGIMSSFFNIKKETVLINARLHYIFSPFFINMIFFFILKNSNIKLLINILYIFSFFYIIFLFDFSEFYFFALEKNSNIIPYNSSNSTINNILIESSLDNSREMSLAYINNFRDDLGVYFPKNDLNILTNFWKAKDIKNNSFIICNIYENTLFFYLNSDSINDKYNKSICIPNNSVLMFFNEFNQESNENIANKIILYNGFCKIFNLVNDNITNLEMEEFNELSKEKLLELSINFDNKTNNLLYSYLEVSPKRVQYFIKYFYYLHPDLFTKLILSLDLIEQDYYSSKSTSVNTIINYKINTRMHYSSVRKIQDNIFTCDIYTSKQIKKNFFYGEIEQLVLSQSSFNKSQYLSEGHLIIQDHCFNNFDFSSFSDIRDSFFYQKNINSFNNSRIENYYKKNKTYKTVGQIVYNFLNKIIKYKIVN
jgi:hypothetical protein